MTINDHEIKQLYVHYSAQIRDYLLQINAKYQVIWANQKCEYQIKTMQNLLNENIIQIENDDQKWRSNYIKENNVIDNEIMPPLVTNGKYYNDNKLHIHPFVYTDSNELFRNCEQQIYFELMKLFIRPEPIDETKNHSLKNINNYITDGLAAYCMYEIKKTSPDSKDIPENKISNLEYIQTIFKDMINEPQKHGLMYELIFKGSVEQIISYTSDSKNNPIEIYKEFKSKYPLVEPIIEKEQVRKAGYLSSFLYVIVIIAAGIIIALLMR